MRKAGNNPLFVTVTDSRWDAFGAPTLMNRLKLKNIHQQGGVSDQVPPGTYVVLWAVKNFRLVAVLALAVLK